MIDEIPIRIIRWDAGFRPNGYSCSITMLLLCIKKYVILLNLLAIGAAWSFFLFSFLSALGIFFLNSSSKCKTKFFALGFKGEWRNIFVFLQIVVLVVLNTIVMLFLVFL